MFKINLFSIFCATLVYVKAADGNMLLRMIEEITVLGDGLRFASVISSASKLVNK